MLTAILIWALRENSRAKSGAIDVGCRDASRTFAAGGYYNPKGRCDCTRREFHRNILDRASPRALSALTE
jgi:hypothetical protein